MYSMDSSRSTRFPRGIKIFGQSLVEIAFLFPLLMIMLSGLLEMGFFFNQYLAVADSSRNASRFASDDDPFTLDNDPNCDTTTDFYRKISCLAVVELENEQPSIQLCLPGMTDPPDSCPSPALATDPIVDDVIVSVFSITRYSSTIPVPEIKRFPDTTGDLGWSYATDLEGGDQTDLSRSWPHASKITSTMIENRLMAGAPNAGLVVVEVNYHYYQILALPWFTAFVPNPIMMTSYATWGLSQAEPTETTPP
jgi:hypothetical protein